MDVESPEKRLVAAEKPLGSGWGNIAQLTQRAAQPASPRRALALALALWLGLLAFYSLHANFPYYYHNDEPSKVRQIKLGPDRWNLRHPPLMLMMTEGVMRLGGLEREEQTIVRTGRATSAFWMSGAIALLFLTAWLRFGWLAAIPVAGLTAVSPLIFECARYFKEDAILLFGIAGFFLTVEVMTQRSVAGRRLLWPCALLGVTVAWCVSSKYIGIVFLPLGLLSVLVLCPARNRWRGLGLFLAAAVLAFCVFSLPLLLNFAKAATEIQIETVKLAEGDHGVGHNIPHPLFLLRTLVIIPLLSLGLAFALGSWLCLRGFRRQDFLLWLLCGFQLFHLIGLCFIAKYSDRYLLPLLLYMPFLAIAGALAWTGALETEDEESRAVGWRPCTASLVALVAIITLANDLPEIARRYEGFRTDSRAQLQEFIRTNLPPDASLAIDEMVHIYPFQIEGRPVESTYFVADIGTIEDFLTRGITHVAISWDVYYRYMKDDQAAAEGRQALHNHRSNVYRTLVQQGEILWERPGYDPKPLHPGIRLIDIRRIATDTAADTPEPADPGT